MCLINLRKWPVKKHNPDAPNLSHLTPLFTAPLQVPIQFWQHGVADLRLHTEVKPGLSLDYAWDEPTLPSYITLTVKGAGSSEVTADMNFFRENNKLYYENFIYIAASYTFSQYVQGRRGAIFRVQLGFRNSPSLALLWLLLWLTFE